MGWFGIYFNCGEQKQSPVIKSWQTTTRPGFVDSKQKNDIVTNNTIPDGAAPQCSFANPTQNTQKQENIQNSEKGGQLGYAVPAEQNVGISALALRFFKTPAGSAQIRFTSSIQQSFGFICTPLVNLGQSWTVLVIIGQSLSGWVKSDQLGQCGPVLVSLGQYWLVWVRSLGMGRLVCTTRAAGGARK